MLSFILFSLTAIALGYAIATAVYWKAICAYKEPTSEVPLFVPPEQPKFTNYPGTQGLFLGRFESTFREGWEYDLYYNDVSPKAVIARYGNGNAEFDMALCTESVDDNPEALAEALRRVRDAGL